MIGNPSLSRRVNRTIPYRYLAGPMLMVATPQAEAQEVQRNIESHIYAGIRDGFLTYVTGAETLNTSGQTTNFRVASLPPGYHVSRIAIWNEVDPPDVTHVEATPQYGLTLNERELVGYVYLHPGADNPKLYLKIDLLRDDKYNGALKTAAIIHTPPGTQVYHRFVDVCNHQNYFNYADRFQQN